MGVAGLVRGDRERELSREHRVDLDRHHIMRLLQEGEGQAAEPRADLEHACALGEIGCAGNALHGVGVDDEVLAQSLGRPDTEPLGQLADLPGPEQFARPLGHLLGYHSPKARWALSHSRVAAAASSMPRTSAMQRTVSGMRYDPLGLPRCGTGVRYGESVSTRTR